MVELQMFKSQRDEISVCCLPPIHVSTLVKIVAAFSIFVALLGLLSCFLIGWYGIFGPVLFLIASVLLFVGSNKNDTGLFWPYMIVNVLYILYVICQLIFCIIGTVISQVGGGEGLLWWTCEELRALKWLFPGLVIPIIVSLLIAIWCQYVVLKGYQYIEARKRNLVEPIRVPYPQDVPRVVEETVTYPRTHVYDPPRTGHF
ncbi:unnamed protein product [Bursaphelenchus xylophilus]|uniref:(pine wood nematode) hypothetical protein n=1 Tax=Bursaphelenchus xylophilus TaxID=6326 RepID=A0A1I7RZY2_BURXY|nr:unnamed protein product [Bursaphelenchus xylophilus]CAG9109152.1 unnamed protein product [Bursaphelenchus xylophilus]